MTVIHLEDHDITRSGLARLVGVDVKKNEVRGHKYISTVDVDVVEETLRQEKVSALVLDLDLSREAGRDPFAIERMLIRLIIEQQQLDPKELENFPAYRVARLAHSRKVPVALLTNYADWERKVAGLTVEGLREAFHAEAVFRKNDYTPCAAWVKEKLR
jgi:hypothetical protein